MIKFVPGQGWVNDGGGMLSGNPVVLNSPEEKAREDAYFAAQNAWRDGIGNYEQYADGTIADLASLVNGDSWWNARLHHMANEVGQGDQGWFLREFSGRENRDQASEMINRFLGLKEQGYSDQDIMRGIYGENWGVRNPNWMDGNPAGGNEGGGSEGGKVPNAGINPNARRKRHGAWGSGYTDGGYGFAQSPTGGTGGGNPNTKPAYDKGQPSTPAPKMFSEENEGMRKAITTALEKKLLG